MMSNDVTLTRRDFVKVGGALFVTISVPGACSGSTAEAAETTLDPTKLASWLEIHDDGTIIGRTGRTEVGTSVSAFYAQIIAEELHVQPSTITMVLGHTDETPEGGLSANFLFGARNPAQGGCLHLSGAPGFGCDPAQSSGLEPHRRRWCRERRRANGQLHRPCQRAAAGPADSGTRRAGDDRDLPLTIDQPPGIPATYADHAALMFDLQLLAHQSDLTRVTTFMMGHELSGRTYPEIGVPDSHHPVSHHQNDPEMIEKNVKINSFHVSLFSDYVEQLRGTPDGDGSLLDHMVLLYGGGMGDGNRHEPANLPILLLGGEGVLKRGRHIRYADTPLSNLLVTLLDALNVPLKQIGNSSGRLDDILWVNRPGFSGGSISWEDGVDGKTNQILTGGAGACGTARCRPRTAARLAMGGDSLGGCEDRVLVGNLTPLGAAGRAGHGAPPRIDHGGAGTGQGAGT